MGEGRHGLNDTAYSRRKGNNETRGLSKADGVQVLKASGARKGNLIQMQACIDGVIRTLQGPLGYIMNPAGRKISKLTVGGVGVQYRSVRSVEVLSN